MIELFYTDYRRIVNKCYLSEEEGLSIIKELFLREPKLWYVPYLTILVELYKLYFEINKTHGCKSLEKEILFLIKSNNQLIADFFHFPFYADVFYETKNYNLSKKLYGIYFEMIRIDKCHKLYELKNLIYSSIKYLELLDRLNEKDTFSRFIILLGGWIKYFRTESRYKFNILIKTIQKEIVVLYPDAKYKKKRIQLFNELYSSRKYLHE